MTPLNHHPLPQRRERTRGFALLVTVTLLAFLVLILVSLASLTRVETQVATNTQHLAQARQNALMALNIAMGELQRYTGPDQRVTATADIASRPDGTRLAAGQTAANSHSVNGTPNGLAPSGGAASVQAGTRWWTGVWGRSGPGYAVPAQSIYDETPSPVLLNWLISGNQDRRFTVDTNGLVTDSTADGRISANVPTFLPGAPVNWTAANLDPASPEDWTTSTYNEIAILDIQGNQQQAALLVGPATAGTQPHANGEAAVERYVVAPIQDIDVPGDTVPGMDPNNPITVGRYAWWIGDEGVKAHYNISDPYPGRNSPSDDTAEGAEARLRLMTSSRSGIELLPGFDTYPQAENQDANTILSRVIERPQMTQHPLNHAINAQRESFHHITTGSAGILSDTLNGGLRQDLTYFFEMPKGTWDSSPLSNSSIIPPTWSPNWGGNNFAPKWDWLYSFYNTNPNVSNPSLEVRPETATEVGITPIITQIRILLSTDIDQLGTKQSTSNIEPGDRDLPVRCNVAFVLANPYNFTLKIPADEYEFVIKNTFIGPEKEATTPGKPLGLLLFASPSGKLPDSMKELLILRPENSAEPSLLDTVRFVVPELNIPPGKSALISVTGDDQRGGLSLSPPPDGNEEPIALSENNVDNPLFPTLSYFTGNTSLKVTFTETRNRAILWVHNSVFLTTTLRQISTGRILQQVTDSSFSKKHAPFGGNEKQFFLNAHIKFIPPAHRSLNLETAGEKFRFAVYAYSRPFQDQNLRATVIDHTAVDNSGRIRTPIGYAGGHSRSTYQDFAEEFSEYPTGEVPWAEDFNVEVRDPVAESGIFFDFPRRHGKQPPVLSIGHLQHASLTTDDWHPNQTVHYQSGYAVGNSYSHPMVRRAVAVDDRNPVYYKAPTDGTARRHFDMAYLLNTALWDSFFFSGIPQSNNTSPIPAHGRYTPYEEPEEDQLRAQHSSAHLLNQGAFNVNSTSKEAWIAILGSLNNLRVNNDTNTTEGTPLPRTLWQTEPNTRTGDSYMSSGTGDDAYAGYRRLRTQEIDALASEIVKRVRARGPFVSLSHFVNRTLIAATDEFNPDVNDAALNTDLAGSTIPMGRGLSGPLQAAIDASGLNDFQEVNGDPVHKKADGAMGDRVLFPGEELPQTQLPPTNNKGPAYFADKFVDLPNLDSTYTKDGMPGPQGRTSTGIPGWLLQGDILQAIGPALSPRSDTFVVRAYGDTLDPTNQSNVLARAWCEATIQRTPEYVEPETDLASVSPPNLTSSNNRLLGRKYKIISFRWLSADDI